MPSGRAGRRFVSRPVTNGARMRYGLPGVIAAAVVLLSSCGGASPPAGTNVPPSQTAPMPAASVYLERPSPAVPLAAASSSSCALGYAAGSRTFPDSAAGLAAAQRASKGLEPHMVMHVTITNTGSQGIHVHSYVIEFDDSVIPETIQTEFSLSVFLAPRASWAHWQDMGTPAKPVALGGLALHMSSESTLQLFTCHLKSWQ